MHDDEWQSLSREDFEQALDDMGHVMDVTVNDLLEVTERARKHAQLRRREDVLVRNIMSHPVKSVPADSTLARAAEQMLALRISGLPVLDETNQLAGIVTEADFLCAIGVPCHHPAQSLWQRLEEMFSAPRTELHGPNENVASIMSTDVITISPEQSLHDALEVMKQRQVKRLVVIDEQRQPIGMLTRSDLVRAFFKRVRWADQDQG